MKESGHQVDRQVFLLVVARFLFFFFVMRSSPALATLLLLLLGQGVVDAQPTRLDGIDHG